MWVHTNVGARREEREVGCVHECVCVRAGRARVQWEWCTRSVNVRVCVLT